MFGTLSFSFACLVQAVKIEAGDSEAAMSTHFNGSKIGFCSEIIVIVIHLLDLTFLKNEVENIVRLVDGHRYITYT